MSSTTAERQRARVDSVFAARIAVRNASERLEVATARHATPETIGRLREELAAAERRRDELQRQAAEARQSSAENEAVERRRQAGANLEAAEAELAIAESAVKTLQGKRLTAIREVATVVASFGAEIRLQNASAASAFERANRLLGVDPGAAGPYTPAGLVALLGADRRDEAFALGQIIDLLERLAHASPAINEKPDAGTLK